MNMHRSLKMITLFSFFATLATAGEVDGKWIFHKDNTDSLDRALNIQGSSFVSLITTPEGAAYETGWWTENPGQNGKTSVIVRYGDNPPDTIEYKFDGANQAEIWMLGESSRWGTMTRMNCDLSMQYRNKSDPAPEGCAWLHIRGWGYSGLDGECMYSEDWENPTSDANDPMDCLIEAPANWTK